MVATLLPGLLVAAGVLAMGAVPRALDALWPRAHLAHLPAIALIAVVVPVVTLLGADVVWATAGLPRPSPAFGLALAAVIVAGAAYAYLLWVRKAPPAHPLRWTAYAGASGLALLLLTGAQGLDLGLVVALGGVSAATWIYLDRAAEPDVRHPLWWALLIAGTMLVVVPLLVEAIQGGRLSGILLCVGAVMAAIAGLNGLWIRAPGDARRALGWGLVLGVAVPLVLVGFLQVASLRPPAQPGTPVPAAAPAAPLPAAALTHRPLLRFDGGERFRTPLDVDRMLATGDVELCPEGRGLLAHCQTVHSAAGLRVGFGNLRFDTQQIADAGLPATIYAHALRHAGQTYLDYWWYLPDNPADTARGAMCGAGLVIPEIPCFDHQSDWEGVTVVLGGDGRPVAVHYAAHANVVAYPWARVPHPGGHPVVYLARGSHAAYPFACARESCDGDTILEDNRHDGALPWTCAGAGCVTAFPVTSAGRQAGWNAFDGHWGSAICLAGVYCARSDAPRSPGHQGRFGKPWCFNYTLGSDLRHPRPAARQPGCP
jgi:hypothetical protein